MIQDCDNISQEKLSALRLIRSENLGIKTFISLLELFGTASRALEELPSFLQKKGVSKRIKICSESKAFEEIEKVEKFGAQIIYYKDNLYPELLKLIPDYPPVITVFGTNLELLCKKKISIVGSRNSSANSERFSYKVSKEVGKRGYVVVSGLARGVDSYSHMGSIETGTIAVIAGGIDNIYPPENKNLYKEIAEKGLIITENSFGASPKSQNFPQRNRIVAGLSLATLVMEASIKSGSLITAKFAIEQNREVFAVPGFPLDTRHSGTNFLIKQGAYLFEKTEDIISVLDGSMVVQEELFEYKCHNDEDEAVVDEKILEKDLDKIRELILSRLSAAAVDLDDLVNNIKISRKIALLVIVELELEDIVQRTGNNISLVVS
jgi:DNA processing protein